MKIWELHDKWPAYAQMSEVICENFVTEVENQPNWQLNPQMVECRRFFLDAKTKYELDRAERERVAADEEKDALQREYDERRAPGRPAKYRTEEARQMARTLQLRKAAARYYARHKKKGDSK